MKNEGAQYVTEMKMKKKMEMMKMSRLIPATFFDVLLGNAFYVYVFSILPK